MLPCKGPAAAGKHIAYAIIGNGFSVEACQQVSPIAVTVGIGLGGKGSIQRAGGVGIFRSAQDIARSVISPGPGLVESLVVFPDELIGTVVGIAGGVCAVADRGDVAVTVIGIGEVEIALQGGDKRTVPLSPTGGTREASPCPTAVNTQNRPLCYVCRRQHTEPSPVLCVLCAML